MAEETYNVKYQQNYAPGSNATVYNDQVINGGTVYQGCGQQMQQVERFPRCRNDKFWDELYDFLLERGFIGKETHPTNFTYKMGRTERPPKVQPIEWCKTIQMLREFVEGAFAPVIERGVVKLADLEKIVPYVFCKDGKPVALSKNRKECSFDSDALKEFFSDHKM